MQKFGQRGEGKAGCLFWVFLLLIGGMIGYQVIPVKIASMQLEDHMKEMAMTQPRRPQHWFEQRISERALELDLEIPKEQIRVKKYPERVIMDVEFSVPINILGYSFDWDIKIHLDRDIFLI